MKPPKYIKDAILWNGLIGKKGAWVRARDLNYIEDRGDHYYVPAFTGCPVYVFRTVYPYEAWMEKYIGTCNDLRKDENFKK